ncbi:SCO2584 family spore wall biosynthesis protein [Streptomyces sp. NPDC002853]
MPEDVGGTPSFPDGGEPDDDRDRGGADEEFASVVFDEAFVKAAEIHEPTAVERLLAAAQARAEASEAESRRARTRGSGRDSPEDDLYDEGFGPDDAGEFGHDADLDDVYDREFTEYGYGRQGYAGRNRWHRPVAWMLALLMGIGMVALAFTAVYRGASTGRQDPAPPPMSTEPSASAEYGRPPVSATPRVP